MVTTTVLKCDVCGAFGATTIPLPVDDVLYQGDLCDTCKNSWKSKVLGDCQEFGITAVRTSEGRKIHPFRGGGWFTTKEARDWHQAQGHAVPPSGRLPDELLDEYRSYKEEPAPEVPDQVPSRGRRNVRRTRATAKPEVERVDDSERWDARPRIIKVGGVEREFFTIGSLAKALQRKAGTIRQWEGAGIIPTATFRKSAEDPHGEHRLYTRAQIEGMARIASEEGLMEGDLRSVTKTDFTRRVIALFRELATAES